MKDIKSLDDFTLDELLEIGSKAITMTEEFTNKIKELPEQFAFGTIAVLIENYCRSCGFDVILWAEALANAIEKMNKEDPCSD